MTVIEHSALVRYSAEKMYALVIDVERYPEFLSWVDKARVVEDSAERHLAGMDVHIAGIHTTLITRNEFVPAESVTLKLHQGPFDHFEGRWLFKGFGEVGCKVMLRMEFEMHRHVLHSAFRIGFKHIADRLIQDFMHRARQLYGEPVPL